MSWGSCRCRYCGTSIWGCGEKNEPRALDPCESTLEAFGCPANLLTGTKQGCTACPPGYQPAPTVKVPDQLNDLSRK
jgi:hypothetical protein